MPMEVPIPRLLALTLCGVLSLPWLLASVAADSGHRNSLDTEELGPLSTSDSHAEKRSLGYRLALGKRFYNVDLGKRPAFNYDLGKRNRLDPGMTKRSQEKVDEASLLDKRYNFDLGKRYNFDLGKRYNFDLGKRYNFDLGKRDDLQSEEKRYNFDLGKRYNFDLGKRDGLQDDLQDSRYDLDKPPSPLEDDYKRTFNFDLGKRASSGNYGNLADAVSALYKRSLYRWNMASRAASHKRYNFDLGKRGSDWKRLYNFDLGR